MAKPISSCTTPRPLRGRSALAKAMGRSVSKRCSGVLGTISWKPAISMATAGPTSSLYNSHTGTMDTAISNGDGTFAYVYHLLASGFTYVRLADFTGDDNADLFLYRAADGLSFLGVGDGTGGFTFNALSLAPGYDFADIGDLNGDGRADLILYYSTNGQAATVISNGAGGFAFTPMVFGPGFTSMRLADYTGDGNADVTVYNKNNGVAYFGTGTGTGTFSFQSLFWSPGYDYVIPEDVNCDGKVDVILYNSTTGTEYTATQQREWVVQLHILVLGHRKGAGGPEPSGAHGTPHCGGRLRRRRQDRRGRLSPLHWHLVDPRVEHQLHDLSRAAMGGQHRHSRARRLRRRRQDRYGRLSPVHRHLVDPEVEHQLHDLRLAAMGREQRHSRARRLRRRRQDRCRRLSPVHRHLVDPASRAPTTRPTSRSNGARAPTFPCPATTTATARPTSPSTARPPAPGGSCKSSTNYTTYVSQQWGVSTDIPVPGDYDGDGKTDVAVYRPSTGTWWILAVEHQLHDLPRAANGGRAPTFPCPATSTATARPISPSIARPPAPGGSSRSSTNYTTYVSQQWGISTDVPLSKRP